MNSYVGNNKPAGKPFSRLKNGTDPLPTHDRVRECAPERNPSILIVDDDSALRRLIASILEQGGFNVVQAADGLDGWNKFLSGTYDLVITDNEMPGLSGLELLRKVRETSDSVPCIFASGHIPWDANAFPSLVHPGTIIEKPFKISELLQTVGKTLNPHRR